MIRRFHKSQRFIRSLVIGALLALAILFPTGIRAEEHDWMETNWRVDLNSIYKGTNYFTYLAPNNYIYNNDPYGTGWLALYFTAGSPNSTFSQVGITEQGGQFYYFVYAIPGVSCYYPAVMQPDGQTCIGPLGLYVGYLQTDIVQIIRGAFGYWYTYLYYPDSSGTYHQVIVARINRTDEFVHRVFIDTESSGNSGNVPAATIFSHPEYVPYGSVSPVDWTGSVGSCSTSYPIINDSTPTNCFYTIREINGAASIPCPQYNALINFLGDPRIWMAGQEGYSSGYVCTAEFFNGFTSGSP